MTRFTKLITIELPARINPKADKSTKILSADVDNAYYQRMESLVNSSGRLFRCVETHRKFLTGRGFKEDALKTFIVNRRGYSFFNLYQKACKDKSRANGFAIQINYNALYNAVEFNYIPFKYIRLAIDETENLTGQFEVYEDWGKSKWKQIRKDKIKLLDRFNPDPEVIEAQVTRAGSWENWNGQLLWCSPEIDTYPLVPFDSEVESAETDFRIKRFKLKNVSTNFMASYMCVVNGTYTEPEKDAIIADLEAFQGDENASKMFVIFTKDPSQVPKLDKFDLQNNDRLFEWHETSTDERIRKCFGIPPVVLGDLIAGKMGTAREMSDGIAMMNQLVTDIREEVLTEFKKLLLIWGDETVKNYPLDILPLSSFIPIDIPTALYKDLNHQQRLNLVGLPDDGNTNHFSDSLAANNTSAGLLAVMNSTMNPEQKIQALMKMYNWAEITARTIVEAGVTIVPNT